MIATSRSYHIEHLENNFSHSSWKLSNKIIFKIHLKSVAVFIILVNLVVFLNCPHSTRHLVWHNFPPCRCTSWSSLLHPGRRLCLQQAAAPSPLSASPFLWLWGRVLSLGSALLMWAGPGGWAFYRTGVEQELGSVTGVLETSFACGNTKIFMIRARVVRYFISAFLQKHMRR